MKKWICKIFGHTIRTNLIAGLTWLSMEELLYKLAIIDHWDDAAQIASRILDSARCSRCNSSQYKGIWE
jgi:hypothetical protein